jgi:hypothetical protein
MMVIQCLENEAELTVVNRRTWSKLIEQLISWLHPDLQDTALPDTLLFLIIISKYQY